MPKCSYQAFTQSSSYNFTSNSGDQGRFGSSLAADLRFKVRGSSPVRIGVFSSVGRRAGRVAHPPDFGVGVIEKGAVEYDEEISRRALFLLTN
jgi:hypothetical protein